MSTQNRASAPSQLPATSPMTVSSTPPVALARPPVDPSPTGHRAATYFDLDKMILAASSTWALRTPMQRSDLISPRALAYGFITQIPYLLVSAGTQRSSSLMEHLALMSADTNRWNLVEVVEGALTTAIEPTVYTETLDLVEGHRRAGHDVVVVSTSISEMVAPIAHLVKADRAVTTHMEVGEDGLFTGRISRSMLHSEKMMALHEDAVTRSIDSARCWAYSDSISDELMPSAVSHPVAVNPDRDLRRLAQKRDQPIRDFVRPVQLRPRWEPPSLSTRVSVIAHVIGVLAVGGTAAWLMAQRRPRGARGL